MSEPTPPLPNKLPQDKLPRLDTLIDQAGGPDHLAQLCGVSTEAVRKWRERGAVPGRHWATLAAAARVPLSALAGVLPATAWWCEPIPQHPCCRGMAAGRKGVMQARGAPGP